MTKVYVVTSGSYSDYGIEAVFLDKNLAEEYVARSNSGDRLYHDEASIEEWEADVPSSEWSVTHVQMSKEGKVKSVSTEFGAKGLPKSKFEFFTVQYPKPGPTMLLVHVVTDSHERAIKVANELRTQLIALNMWGKGEGDVKVDK